MKRVIGLIDKGILAHSQWKYHIQSAITTGHCQFSVKEAKDPTMCEFGKWLYSNEALWLLNLYPQLGELHKQFHEEASEIVALVLQHRISEAKAHFQLGSHFSQLTAKLVNLLVEIKDKLSVQHNNL